MNNPDEQKVPFDDLLRLYVGKNYDKFEDTPFSIWQFLFGPFYSFYRKHYSYGIFSIIVIILSNTLISKALNSIASIEYYSSVFKNEIIIQILEFLFLIAVNYMLSKKYNKTYIKYASNKVKKIMFSNKNYDATQQKKKCIKRGNPSILSIIIGLASIYLFLFIISYLITTFNLIKTKIESKQTQQIGIYACKEINKKISNTKTGIIYKIEDFTDNKYSGHFYINNNKEITILSMNEKNIFCSGSCGDTLKCHKKNIIK